jgi:hypothetical protein
VSEEDWRAIQQPLHLAQIPGMSASIREGIETSHKEMSKDLEW